jgi:hypothetical protein
MELHDGAQEKASDSLLLSVPTFPLGCPLQTTAEPGKNAQQSN